MTKSLKLIYVAHPVGHGEAREENLKRALKWFHWLLHRHPDFAFAMPWYPYCLGTDESAEGRRRGLRDDLEAVRRCDEVWLVGGRVSPSMEMEANEARRLFMPVNNTLLQFGPEPPAPQAPTLHEHLFQCACGLVNDD